jgi:hypothetical protein
VEKIEPLFNKEQTVWKISELCKNFCSDLDMITFSGLPLSLMTPKNYYDYIRSIPFRLDEKPVELVGRPLRLIELDNADCKKKSIFIGSYAERNRIPYRFCVVSQRRDRRFHHIYPELFVMGAYTSFDATYPYYFIGMNKKYTAKEVFTL